MGEMVDEHLYILALSLLLPPRRMQEKTTSLSTFPRLPVLVASHCE